MQAKRLASGKIKIWGNTWSEEFDEERRQPWIEWYRKMYEQYDRENYKICADVLEALNTP